MNRSNRPPTMVFAGEFARGAGGFGLAQGFRRLGWVVEEVDLSRLYPRLGQSFAGRLASRLLDRARRDLFDQTIRRLIGELRPDMFLSMKGTRISRQLLEWIGTRGVRRAMFYPDFHFNHNDVDLDSFELYELISTTKSFHVKFLGDRFGADKVIYVPHGYSEDIHWQMLGNAPDEADFVDLQHIGAHSAYKQRWLEALREGNPDSSMRIVGSRWDPNDAQLKDVEIRDAIFDTLYSRALQSARINVAVLMGPHPSGWQDFVSQRTFEIPACGSFMLHEDNDEVREFFTPGVEIDVFASEEELVDKARFYLDNPEVRKAMTQRAHERAVPAYGYGQRAVEIDRAMRRLI